MAQVNIQPFPNPFLKEPQEFKVGEPSTPTVPPVGTPSTPTTQNAQPGIIQNAKSTSYTPEKIALDPASQTVEGRITNLLKKDSPLLTDARTRAAQVANARGLINSSMAVGEGEKAVIQTAFPIASQDANAALTVAGRNQEAANQAGQFGAGAENVMRQQELSGEQAMEQQELRGAQSKELAQIEAQFKQIMQTNDSAARFFSQISASIGDILKEPNIGIDQKNQLVQKQIDLLKAGLAVIGGIENLDLVGLLNFDNILTLPNTESPLPPQGAPVSIQPTKP